MKIKYSVALLAAFTALVIGASAASIGLNNASGSTSWNDADNTNIVGSAFGNWGLSANDNGGFAGFFIGNSASLDEDSGGSYGADINSDGRSFGLYGNGGGFADASLYLTSALDVGQSLTLDLAVNFRNGNKGVDISNDSGDKIFNFNIGNDDYVVNDSASGNGSIGDDYSGDTAFSLTFTQTSAIGGDWEIERSGGVIDSVTGTYDGVVGGLKLYIVDTEGGDNNNLFANNFAVIPEPSMAALLGLGALALLRRRK